MAAAAAGESRSDRGGPLGLAFILAVDARLDDAGFRLIQMMGAHAPDRSCAVCSLFAPIIRISHSTMETVVLIGLITGIALIALGLLAAYSSIIAQRSDTPSYIDALVPYQGWLSCLCGISVLFFGVLHFGQGWALETLVGVFEVVLGLVLGYLGYRLITKRGEEVRPYRTSLGYLAIVLGVWTTFETLWFSIAAVGVHVG